MITLFESGGNILNQPKDKSPYSSWTLQPNKLQNTVPTKGQYFEIHIKGQISDIWADWFEGMTIKYLDNEEMLLAGYIVDQSALMGILNKLARLNLTLISVNEIKEKK